MQKSKAYIAEIKVDLHNINGVKQFASIMTLIDGEMDLYSGRYVIDAKSIMGIFSLDISKKLTLGILRGDVNQIKNKLSDFIVNE